MTKPTKYVARYEGQIVGTRKSPRPYAFAIVMQDNEQVERDAAYGFTGKGGRGDLQDEFEYATNCASAQPGESYGKFKPGYSFPITAEMIAKGRAEIEGGWEGYVARKRAAHVASFEKKLAGGGFKPYVCAWSMTRHNAEKAAANPRRGWHALGATGRVIAIVNAEVA